MMKTKWGNFKKDSENDEWVKKIDSCGKNNNDQLSIEFEIVFHIDCGSAHFLNSKSSLFLF